MGTAVEERTDEALADERETADEGEADDPVGDGDADEWTAADEPRADDGRTDG